jgi:hypothetical protein
MTTNTDSIEKKVIARLQAGNWNGSYCHGIEILNHCVASQACFKVFNSLYPFKKD